MEQIISVFINEIGTVDVKIHPSRLDLESHARVIGTIVKMVAQGNKEAIRDLLRQINRTAHSGDPLNIQSVN